MNGYLLLLVLESLLCQSLHHIQMPKIGIDSMGNKQVLDLTQDLLEHFHLL